MTIFINKTQFYSRNLLKDGNFIILSVQFRLNYDFLETKFELLKRPKSFMLLHLNSL